MRRWAWLLAIAALAVPGRAAADELRWRDEWGVVSQQEYGVALTFGALTLLIHTMPVKEVDWGTVEADERTRNWLRFESPTARAVSRTASDLLFYSLMAYPVVVDSLLVTLPRNDHVAWQMLVLDLETLAVAGLVAVTLEHIMGRQRPYVRECVGGPSEASRGDCTASGPKESYKSFPSGHALMAFASAGLICANHVRLPLYGGGAPDRIACGAAMGLATVQSALRITGDRHYLSDVLLGAALGSAIGYGLPTVLHYGKSDDDEGAPAVPAPGAVGAAVPVWTGRF